MSAVLADALLSKCAFVCVHVCNGLVVVGCAYEYIKVEGSKGPRATKAALMFFKVESFLKAAMKNS